jgi:hypothetical protein
MLPPSQPLVTYVMESYAVTVRMSYSPLAREIACAGAVIDVTVFFLHIHFIEIEFGLYMNQKQ